MRTTLLATALIGILGVSSVIAATDNPVINQRVQDIKTEFNLDEQQTKRLEALLTRAGMTPDEAKTARMKKHMERRLSRMKEKLGLTDTQAEQIKAIMAQQHDQMKAVRDQGKASITAVLTPEQAAKMEEMHEGRKGKRGRHGKRGGGMCGKH